MTNLSPVITDHAGNNKKGVQSIIVTRKNNDD